MTPKSEQVIHDLLTKEAVFQDGHFSSAINFENKLKRNGFVSPFPIHHDYNFPDGFTEAEFENHIMGLIYIYYFSPSRITNPSAYLERFCRGTTTTRAEMRKLWKDLLEITDSLTDDEKQEVLQYFRDKREYVVPELQKLLAQMRELNPEILDINISEKNPIKMFDLFIGMTSKFHHDDIKYFCENRDFDISARNQDRIKEVIGFCPHYFMEPSRIDHLVSSLIIQKQKKAQNTTTK